MALCGEDMGRTPPDMDRGWGTRRVMVIVVSKRGIVQ